MKGENVESVTYADPTQYKSSLDFDLAEFDLAQGLVAVGGKLDVGTLFHAYSHGIFPWPQEGLPLLWFSPDPRGVLFFEEFHFPDRLEREWKKKFAQYRFSFNEAFSEVIENCRSQPRPGQQGTWIISSLQKAYEDFHKKKFAHSVECWEGDQLVGGIYGVLVQGIFSGESMFHKEDNCSKFVLRVLIEKLQSLGLKWMDIQMVTPVLASMGGREIPRTEYLALLKQTQKTANS